MGPINYLGMMPQDDFTQSILGGLQVGASIRDMQSKRAAEESARLAEQQYQADISAAMGRPTPQAFSALALKYPKHREAFKQGWEQLNADQQQNELRDASTLAAALQSGRPDIAQSKLEERITAMESSGQDAAPLKFLLDRVKTDPTNAYGSVLQVVAGMPGGDKVLENLGKVGQESRAAAKAPAELRQAEAAATGSEADATTKTVTAKYAESNALKDLEVKGWNVEGIKADIDYKKQSTRIAAMNAAISREGNDLKKQELRLKLDDAVRARDDKIREKVSTAEAGATSIDNMLNTIERVKKNPALNAVVGSIEGGRFYPQMLTGMLPGTAGSDDRADAMALIETLSSQAFVAQIPNIKGTGALSDAEGKKLQSALQNLSREQSEKQFRENLDEAARLLKKGRENISRSTGVPLPKPDTPAAPGARPPLESFNKP